ncbi:VOC family protein [Microvirga antarctica]|uniref:VOC family protein n=1 Tax=Microvirga antarctica TaxID=2819233 RepID=UPI001B3142BA|nr:VOC family protein [Microvirga antarctica]
MTQPDYILLYVENPKASGRFYADLLEAQPVEATDTFVLFVLASGLKLGLWGRRTVEPVPTGMGGGAEVAFRLGSEPDVDATFAEWTRRGLTILQTPVSLDFGRTFVALDPDGHRLRVFAPASA